MSDESPRPAANCHFCGKRIKPTKTNKAQSYCDDKCRQAAYRARRRAREDPSVVDAAITSHQAEWRYLGYSDELIQALMALWTEHGGRAIDATEKILRMHDHIVVERFTAAYMKDAAIRAAEIQTMREELEAMRRNGT